MTENPYHDRTHSKPVTYWLEARSNRHEAFRRRQRVPPNLVERFRDQASKINLLSGFTKFRVVSR